MELFWIVTGSLAAWLISLYRWPFRPCTWCKGTGRSRGSNSRRFGNCWRCHGNGRVQRAGSRALHRLAWAIRGEVGRARARRAEQRAADRADHPRHIADRHYR